jgi:uncharacterized protein
MQNKSQMQEYVLDMLRSELPKQYYYHNPEHTLYVQEKTLEIGRNEGCSEHELNLLDIAALWHDTGYTRIYKNHEEQSCQLARHYLPEYGISSADIDTICSIIMATKIPQSPKNKLEEIIADADLEYLGTETFENKSQDLFHELYSLNPSLTKDKWNEMQISFISNHKYFTRFCQESRESIKQTHLDKLIRSSL